MPIFWSKHFTEGNNSVKIENGNTCSLAIFFYISHHMASPLGERNKALSNYFNYCDSLVLTRCIIQRWDISQGLHFFSAQISPPCKQKQDLCTEQSVLCVPHKFNNVKTMHIKRRKIFSTKELAIGTVPILKSPPLSALKKPFS